MTIGVNQASQQSICEAGLHNRPITLTFCRQTFKKQHSHIVYGQVNKKLGRSHEVGILKTASGENTITDQSKANTLNSLFSSVNVRDNNVIPEFSLRVSESTMLDNI